MASTQNVPFFKKKKGTRPGTARRRSASPDHADSIAGSSTLKSTVVLPNKKAASNLLSAGTKRTTSQRDELDETGKDGPDVKWTAEGSHVNQALDILAGDEAEELLAKRRRKERLDAGEVDEPAPDDGQYHGKSAYRTLLKKTTETPKAMRVGPQRSTNTIRTVTIVDYQPDVCKDYKETGYCGFGDTCKFLHDRGTYLAGWQLDKLAESQNNRVNDDGDSGSDSSDEEDVPFACLVCRKPYTDPVVTRCGHYFCSACAIKRFAKTPKCLACGAPTGGIFNRADKIIEKTNKKRQEREDREAEGSEGDSSHIQIEGLGENRNKNGQEDESDTSD